MPGLERFWWALRDSNPEPRDYESPALTVAPRALMNGECNSNKGNSGLISSLHVVNTTMHEQVAQRKIKSDAKQQLI